MWNRSDHKPIVVPDKQMEDFIRVCSASNEEVLYLSDLSAKLRNGAKVRVINGPFLGVEGTVVRIKKSRRIMVEIPGIIAAASAYIPMEDLELIEN
jgi:transcription antitermination factor NusG